MEAVKVAMDSTSKTFKRREDFLKWVRYKVELILGSST